MSEVTTIYTVETGAYSDHTIHAFCTSLDEAKRIADALTAKQVEDMGVEPTPGDNWNWPEVYANPVDTGISWQLQGDAKSKRVKWCDRDPVPA